MKDLTPVMLVLLAAAIGYAVYLWRRVAKLETQAQNHARALDERSQEAEKARREGSARQKDLEQTKKLLQETKTKLKKQQKETHGSSPGKKVDEIDTSAQPSLAAIVRISDQEVEAEHRRVIEKLESELQAALDEVSRLRKNEENRRAEAERAARSLAAADAAPGSADPEAAEGAPRRPRSPEEEIEARSAELEALRKAALERERELKKEIRKAQENANNALKRASNNHQLYQVIKGQLDLAEDRLAQLRRKYEGAKSLEELRREGRRRSDRARTPSSQGGTPAPGPSEGEASKPGDEIEASPLRAAVYDAAADAGTDAAPLRDSAEPDTRER